MAKLWLLVLLVPLSRLNAQTVPQQTETIRETTDRQNTGKRAPESFMTGQIKHVGDFIDRFNNAAKAGNDGEGALKALFNEDDSRLPGQGRLPHPYADEANAFIEAMISAKTVIPKRSVMQAVTGLKVNYTGAADTLVLHLRKDYTADSAAYWHIIKAIDPRRLPIEQETARKMEINPERMELPPNAHEVSFLPLLRGLDDYHSLAPFTHCKECRDAGWQKVENALQSGRLRAEAVLFNKLYLTVGNWEIELKEFIREKENSGWLISDLIEK